jgi:UDP-N-acetylmuramoyl-tripeptide--D-alanyl-D-alanine ligase
MVFVAPDERAAVTFGFSAISQIRGSDIQTNHLGQLSITVEDQDSLAPPQRIDTKLTGTHLAINVLAAIAAAVAIGIRLPEAAAALQEARPLSAHRMAVNELSNGALVLDDSYNSNPESVEAALATAVDLANRAEKKLTVVLGSMLELGAASKAQHRRLGNLVARSGAHRLITVGEEARYFHESAQNTGGIELLHLPDTAGLADRLWDEASDHFILLKGSHGIGLWQVADELVEPTQDRGDGRA